jgi:uncharacterized protein with HEPN domain
MRKYLYDIVQACELLVQFIEGKALSDYSSDPMLRSAVERQFEVIGEALNQALRLDPDLSERISDTKRIIAFRNRLIHGYADISNEMVWGVIETNLPVLFNEVKSLLDEINDSE